MDETEKFATPRVAAGVLFRDELARILLVKPTYKAGWEIPGGYVEKGESPRAAAIREVAEELGIDVEVSDLLVLDWAPHAAEGDKLLFIFDGGTLDKDHFARLALDADEIAEVACFSVEQLPDLLPDRLARRVIEAASAHPRPYLEHGRRVIAAPQADSVGG